MNLQGDDFETLRKMLALKRYEQPPPGYFDRLPDNIMARLERGDGQSSFWEKLERHFVFRPAFAFSFALAALSALTVSVVDSVRMQSEETAQTPSNNGWRTGSPEEALASQYDSSQVLHVPGWTGNENSSNVAVALPSLFAPAHNHHLVPVSYASP